MLIQNTSRKAMSFDELLEEMWKTPESGNRHTEKVLIKVNPKKIEMQRQDVTTVEKLIKDIKAKRDRDGVFIQSAIAVGYANAMQAHGVIKEDELKQLNTVISTIAERRLAEVEKLGRKKFFRKLLCFGKAEA